MTGSRQRTHQRGAQALAAGCFATLFGLHAAMAGDPIRVAYVSSSLASIALVVANAKGYFKEQGLDATLVPFDAAQPIAIAATSGDVDFGSTGLTDAFCVLANQGALKIIGGDTNEQPGFHSLGFLASNQAYAAGVRSVGDFTGHSVGIPQFGTVFHYALGRTLEHRGIGLKDVRVIALQSNANVASALTGGQIDASIMSSANLFEVVDRGGAKSIGWLEDEVKGAQTSGTFTTAKIANNRPDTVRHFLAAFRTAAQAWDSAFVDAQGNRADQPSAPAMIALAAKALNQSPEVIKESVTYVGPEASVHVADIQVMLDWFESHGMQKSHIDAMSLIDTRYAKLEGKE
ncbi:MAG TPA: ABC transporter substrate-binding protein [Stellaceae bacterium]|jgi:NitT/TauT family transport system substrate-binding protein